MYNKDTEHLKGDLKMRTENLKATRQKSYYGKAKVVYGDDGVIMLKSYDTLVAKIENGKLVRMWGGWSATTMNHIKDFCAQFEIPCGNKKWWCDMPCENEPSERWKVVAYNCMGMEYKPSAIYDSYEQAITEAEKYNENGNPFWFYDVVEA